MKLYEVLDKMYETNEVCIMERPEKVVFNGMVKNAIKSKDEIDISRKILSIRPVSNNMIKIWLEND